MNVSVLIGIAAAVATVYFGVFRSISDPKFFLDAHALILVIGGTTAAALLAFPIQRFATAVLRIVESFFSNPIPPHVVVEQLYYAALVFNHSQEIDAGVRRSHPFISDAMYMLSSGRFSPEQLADILRKRIGSFKRSRTADAKMIHSLAKFPPAFGLLGASSGMIAMMLGLKDGGASSIGPAMAVALVATFWGIAVANLVLLPLADYAKKLANDEVENLALILEGVLLIQAGTHPAVLLEYLRSELPADERAKVQVVEAMRGQRTQAGSGDFNNRAVG